MQARLTRSYPQGPLGSHLVGYVGRINEAELQRIDAVNYRGTDHIGKTGVEQAFEDDLHGVVGFQHVETNARGRTLRVLERVDPRPGRNLYLTIDASLQRVAEQALAGENGAIVAIDPASGAVLAFASIPTFDPNAFVDGIDSKAYRALLESPDRPLFNRALNGRYPPGSTIKPFIGLAGLEEGTEHAHQESWCPGFFRLPGKTHRYRDWKKGGHGRVGIRRAIVESCDVFFYELALELGIDRMHRFMTRFGFGRKTGIDLRGESSGLMPSREWKRGARGQPWYPGETLITGIGQGFMLATPLQLASATATLSMRGVRLRPQAVLRRESPETGEVDELEPDTLDAISPQDARSWDEIIQGMVDVVHAAPRHREAHRRRHHLPDGRQDRDRAGVHDQAGRGVRRGGPGEGVARSWSVHRLCAGRAPAHRGGDPGRERRRWQPLGGPTRAQGHRSLSQRCAGGGR